LVDPRLSHKCCTVSTYCTILYPLFSIDIKTNMTDPTFSLPFPVAQVAAPPTHTTQVNSGGGWNDPISLHQQQQQPAIMNGVSLEQHSATIPSASVASAYAAVATTTSSSNPPTTITTTTTNPAAGSTTTMAPTPQPRENWRLVSGGGLETSEQQQQQQQQQQPNNNNTTVPFFFADDASIRSLVTRVSMNEQAHVLEALGETYTAAFQTVGFCHQRPVQILSPFAFPPGPERRSFLEAFTEVCWMDWFALLMLLFIATTATSFITANWR